MNTGQKKSKSTNLRGPKKRAILPPGSLPSEVVIGYVKLEGNRTIKTKIVSPHKLLPGLSVLKRNEICAYAGVNFISQTDWLLIQGALQRLALDSKIVTIGVSVQKVKKKIGKIEHLAEALHKAFLDSDEGKIANRAISQFLEFKADNTRIDFADLAMSQIVLAARQARKPLETKQADRKKTLGSFTLLVGQVERIFSEKGVVVSAPKPKAYSVAQPSQFQKFLRALLLAEPKAAPSINCSEAYLSALMSRISEALKEWRGSARRQSSTYVV